jgi:hypothetical protein
MYTFLTGKLNVFIYLFRILCQDNYTFVEVLSKKSVADNQEIPMISVKEIMFYGVDKNDNLYATGESNAQNTFQEKVNNILHLDSKYNTMQ